MKIMLIDDETSMQILVRQIVIGDGYEFLCASDGETGVERVVLEKPDLVILDVMMPKMNGFQVCRRMRECGIMAPVIFLSARGDIIDKSEGFDAGGNDYLVKPFDPQELSIRIKAHLRQFHQLSSASQSLSGRLSAGPIDIDAVRHQVVVNGVKVDLTAKEFRILFLLASHPGEVFTREQLVGEAWGKEFIGETSSLAVFIRRIREKIEDDPSCPAYIQTVRNVGYKFEIPCR